MAEEQVQVILRKLERIEERINTALGDIDDHEERLRSLEGKGGKRWDSLTGTVITAVAAAFAGWLLGQIK